MNNGTLAALGAYIFWGLMPIYWKAVESRPRAGNPKPPGGLDAVLRTDIC